MKKLFILFAIFAHVLAAQNVPNYVPTNGLVGWWPFNGNAADHSGNNYNGIIHGATLSIDRKGHANEALYFDGINDYVQTSSIPSLNSSSNTLSFWVKSNSYDVHHQIEYAGSNFGVVGRGIAINQSRFANVPHSNCTDASGAGLTNLNGQLTTNIWHNIVFVSDGSVSKFFINGNFINQTTLGTGICSSNLGLIVGRGTNGSGPMWFTGNFDDIGIWNRALTPAEIQTLYYGCTDTLAQNPTSATATVGTNATFTALSTASGAAYQWQAKNGSNFVNVSNAGQFSGSTSSTLTVNSVTSANNGLQVRCIVDHGDCVDTSAVAVLSSCFAINSQPANQYVVPASSATFAVSTNDPSCTYQWQTNAGFGFQNLSNAGQFSGVTSNTLTVSTVSQANNNQLFRCLVSAGTCLDTTVSAKIVLSGVGVSENALMRASVSPTPTRGSVDLDVALEGTYTLIGIDGRIVQSGALSKILDFSNQPAGIYSLRLETSAGYRVVKVVKE